MRRQNTQEVRPAKQEYRVSVRYNESRWLRSVNAAVGTLALLCLLLAAWAWWELLHP